MAKRNPTTLKTGAGHWVLIDEPSGAKFDDSPSEIPNTSTARSIARHPKFFFDNVLVAIQVEDTLFNVHKYQLVKSEVFSDMFKIPKVKTNEPEEGSSPDHPIVLEGVAASDFSALLTVLYASDQPAPGASLIIPAFRLANMFNFSDLRAYLLPLAEKNLDDVDKVVFAREFDIEEWLVPAHIRLCKREALLSTEEARKLGVDSTLMISHMREQHRSRGTTAVVGQIYCPTCAGMAYYGTGNCGCGHCGTTNRLSYLRYDGAGVLEAKTDVEDTALEAEVKKWVQDNRAVRG